MNVNNKVLVNKALHILGLLLCTAPPIIATLSYFPLWREAGGAQVISGGALLFMILSSIPLYKYIRRILESAATYILWLFIFLFCFLLSKVIAEVTVIALVGFISNVLGAILMKIAEKRPR
jgi:hypothetical protein